MGAPGFNIEVNYSGPASYQSAINAAVDRWQQVITGDLPDVMSPNYGIIDDLLIRIVVTAIDGTGEVLADAYGDELLHDVAGKKLASHGEIRLDSADIATLSATGKLQSLVLHEIGHVLGLGDRWDAFGLVNASSYTGPNALAVYRQMTGDYSVSGVPLETYGGDGTDYSHWRENVFVSELMTGFQEGPGQAEPLSALTIAALKDLGYTVNMSAADFYLLPPVFVETPLSLKGKGRADELYGGTGADRLKGKGGDDRLFGSFGDDVISGGKGKDYVDGEFGNDHITGGKGDDRLFGDFGNDFVSGGKGDDTLGGEDGADTLIGGKGKDILNGGTGNDIMSGGKKADTFFFGDGFGIDTVTDFRPGQDKLEFYILGINSVADVMSRIVQIAGGSKIDFGSHEVILQNVNPWDIASTDILIS